MNADEYGELEQQTGRIAENLKYIEKNLPSDLEDLEISSSNTAVSLRYIEENSPEDLESLQEQTGTIATNLQAIADNETDLDALEAQLDRIISKLEKARGAERE
jgi:septal ring factor EnvC (AmiA/AmiB activator)